MRIVNVKQGSSEWLEHRKGFFNASDAPAMMGCSPYKTRAQLIKELATGISPEVDANTQRIFDAGHAAEAKAREIAEDLIGSVLYPVTGVLGNLSASFDGLTLDSDTVEVFEHKSLNDELRAALPLTVYEHGSEKLPLHYRVQMQQQLMVSGALRVLFMASKWNGDECEDYRWCWHYSDADLADKIAEGWKLLAHDVANYVPAEDAAPAVAAHVDSLPAVSISIGGSLSVSSNLDAFGKRLREFISEIDTEPSTDQGFADAEAAVKILQKAQDALEAAEANALAQVSDVEAIRRAVSDFANLARTTRLSLEKTVKARKEQIKVEIVREHQSGLAEHIAELNADIGGMMPVIPADFGAAIKGLKTVSSVREKAGAELVRAKIEASRVAAQIKENISLIGELAADSKFLFPDIKLLVLKDKADLTAIIHQRKTDHEAAEAKRIAAEAEKLAQKQAAEAARAAAAKAEAENAAAKAAEAETAKKRANEELFISSQAISTPPARQSEAPEFTAEQVARAVANGLKIGYGEAILMLVEMERGNAFYKLMSNNNYTE